MSFSIRTDRAHCGRPFLGDAVILASTRCVVGRVATRHSISVMTHSAILSGAGASRFFTSLSFSGHVSRHQHSAHHRPL